MTVDYISIGFIVASIYNFSIILFSKGFQGDLGIHDPLFGTTGSILIVVWGIVFFALRNLYARVPAVVLACTFEKLVYVINYIVWLVNYNHKLSTISKTDPLASIFFSVYGIGDAASMLFFAYVAYHWRSNLSDSLEAINSDEQHTNRDYISIVFIIALIYNSAIILFSKFFQGDLGKEDILFCPAGCVLILVWGLVFFAIRNRYKLAASIVLTFTLEKLVYVISYLVWLIKYNNRLPIIFKTDPLTAMFFSIYGIGDASFMIFFCICCIPLAKRISSWNGTYQQQKHQQQRQRQQRQQHYDVGKKLGLTIRLGYGGVYILNKNMNSLVLYP